MLRENAMKEKLQQFTEQRIRMIHTQVKEGRVEQAVQRQLSRRFCRNIKEDK
jgi:hypothetical protein